MNHPLSRSGLALATTVAAAALVALGYLAAPGPREEGIESGKNAAGLSRTPRTSTVRPGETLAPPPSLFEGGSRRKESRLEELLSGLRAALETPYAWPGQALLTFASRGAMEAFAAGAARRGVAVTGALEGGLTLRVAFPSLEALGLALETSGEGLAELGANYVVSVPAVPEAAGGSGDKPFLEATLASIGAGPERDRSAWGEGVTVALVDTGIAPHPALAEERVTRMDLTESGGELHWHGTAMASLVAGNLPGAEGVAPAARLLDVRVAGREGRGDSFLLARGITLAAEQGARVINVSMGSRGDAPAVARAVEQALARGIAVVAAAGNDGAAALAWPAAYPGVISVSGVDAAGRLATFSNSGNPSLAAPAVGIPSALALGDTAYLARGDGTSQAAALASGAAAAILSGGGTLPGDLLGAARPAGDPARTGAGLLWLPGGGALR